MTAALESPRAPAVGTGDRDRLTIAMFSHNYVPHPGGLEVVVQNLVRGLAGRGHRVVLVTSDWEGTAGVSHEDGLIVHRLPAIHWTEARGGPSPVPRGPGLAAAMRAVRDADVVHAHGALYAQTLLAARAARRAGAPLVLTEHVGFVEYRAAAVNAIERAAWWAIGDRMLARAAAVTALNDRVRGWLAARSRRPVHFIGNGVALERFRPRRADERRALRRSFGLPEDQALVLFAGRASEKKNLDVVLAAPREGHVLVVCGAKRDLRGERLVDLGVLPHARMPELFACVDAMVNPSTGEGFPLVVLEAVASGVPLVLMWDDGYAGWLPREVVVACDRVEAIAPALDALVADAARRRALAAAGRAWAEARWSWESVIHRYEELYHDVRVRSA